MSYDGQKYQHIIISLCTPWTAQTAKIKNKTIFSYLYREWREPSWKVGYVDLEQTESTVWINQDQWVPIRTQTGPITVAALAALRHVPAGRYCPGLLCAAAAGGSQTSLLATRESNLPTALCPHDGTLLNRNKITQESINSQIGLVASVKVQRWSYISHPWWV